MLTATLVASWQTNCVTTPTAYSLEVVCGSCMQCELTTRCSCPHTSVGSIGLGETPLGQPIVEADRCHLLNSILKILLLWKEGSEDDVEDDVLREDERPTSAARCCRAVVSTFAAGAEVMPADEALEAPDLSHVELQKWTELSICSPKVLCCLDLAHADVGEEPVSEPACLST